MYIEGINPKLTYVASLEAPIPFGIGTRGMDELGREYVFASIATALTLGDVVLLPLGNSGSAVALTTTAAVNGYYRQVGVVVATFAAAAAGTGFWAQTLGAGNARAATSALVAIPMYTSATAGALDDTAAANNLVRGIAFTTAPSGAGVFPAILNNPTIGTIADTDNNT